MKISFKYWHHWLCLILFKFQLNPPTTTFICIAKMIKILSFIYSNFSPVKLTLHTTSIYTFNYLPTYLIPYKKKKNNQNQTIKNVHHDDRKLTTYTLNRWRRYTKTMRWKIKKKTKRTLQRRVKNLFYFSSYIFDFLCPAESLNTLNKKPVYRIHFKSLQKKIS